MLLPPTCLSFGLPVSPACQSVSQTSMDDSGHKGNTLEFKGSGCAVSDNLIYDSSLSLSVSVKVTKCASPPFCRGGVGLSLQQILKRGGGGLTGPQLLEGGCWERGGDFFQGGGCNCHIN